MPRYFFHIHDGVVTPDEEGVELADEAAARVAAIACIRGLLGDQVRAGRLCLHHRLEIADAAGTSLFCMRFGDAVRVEE